MTNTPRKPRKLRLQFSLRMLLVLMAVVGVGLTIFRWPWVDVEQHFEKQLVQQGYTYSTDPFAGDAPQFVKEPTTVQEQKLIWEKRTTYRRNWRGKPVKHGLANHHLRGQLKEESHYYDNLLHGRRKVFDYHGRLVIEASFRSGLLHGAMRGGDGNEWYCQGQYERGSWHGKWRTIVSAHHYHYPFLSDQFASDGSPLRDYFNFPQDPLILESEWQTGRRHGHWRWFEPNGKLLRTADFQNDEVVLWNSQPVVAEFLHLLNETRSTEPELVAAIEATQGKKWQRRYPWEERLCFQVEESDGQTTLLTVHLMQGKIPRLRVPAECGNLIPYLAEVAARNDFLFEVRYGSLWLVGANGKWSEQDATGIADIKFPTGTPAARAWSERVNLRSSNAPLADCLNELLRDTELTIDTSAFDVHLARVADPRFDRLKRVTTVPGEGELLGNFRRSDAVALTLFLAGCHCTLSEDTLIVTPRAEQLWSQPITYPHIGSYPLPLVDVRRPRGRVPPSIQVPGKGYLDPFQ